MKRLLEMLSYTRAHQSEGERLFVDKFINPYNPEVYKSGNEVLAYVVTVGGKKRPPVLWSSHVDTVHSMDDAVMQTAHYDESGGFVYKDDGRPLGADDGAGVWLLLEMIDAKVAGTYIFHRGEECGGIGSSGMAKHHKEWLSQFKWAIAFDRRGDGDVIIEQSRGVCASNEFAQQLSTLLNISGMSYAPSDMGIFTDTANYRNIIPECTNVSVGYDNEHTGNETLDAWHLSKLRDVMVSFNTQIINSLPALRDHTIVDEWDAYGKWSYPTPKRFKSVPHSNAQQDCVTLEAEEIICMTYKKLVKLVTDSDPHDVADLISRLAEDASYMREQYEDSVYYDDSSRRVYK